MFARMWDGMTLIPGRECGDCTVCCVVPNIDKPEIQKLSGARCRHCTGGGCAIYDSRPPVCRAFYCAWRTVDIFERGLAARQIRRAGAGGDRRHSGAFRTFHRHRPDAGGQCHKIVRQKWFQDFVVTGVMNSVPLFLSLPGPRGHQAATVFLNNEQMLDAVKRGER